MSRWIRLNTDIFVSEWLYPLSAGARLAWVCLLLYVKAQGVGGRAKKMTTLIASRQWLVGEEDVAQMLSAATSDNAVKTENGEWVITGWPDYQEPSTERVRKSREMKRCETNETLGNKCDTTETETRTRTLFAPPSIEEVENHLRERGWIDPQGSAVQFVAHYQANGWRRGSGVGIKIRDWKACVITWEKKDKKGERRLKAWNE